MDTDEHTTARAPLRWSTLKEALGQKRRVIYMDDQAWEKLRSDAGHARRSISAYLRDLVDGDTAIADRQLIASRQVELEDEIAVRDETVELMRVGAAQLADEIAAKDEEIARLKRELAARPSLPAANTSLMGTVARGESFGAPHPAPKTRKAR